MLFDKWYYLQRAYLLCNVDARKRKKGGKRYVPAGNCSLHAHI